LTGSSGYIGKQIIQSYSDKYSLDTLSRSGGVFHIDLSKNIPVFYDVYDLVIHAAGIAHVIPKAKEEIGFYNTNVTITNNLLKGLTPLVPKRFVFISSVSVYGLLTGNEVDENYSLDAKDPYGKSKIESEEIVARWCDEHGVVCTFLRLPLVVGANPPGSLGSMIRGIQNNYYVNIGGGNARKSMVLAVDVANAIIDASCVGGIYNLTDGYHPSFSELSDLVSIQLGKRKSVNIPMWLAKLLASCGDVLGKDALINTGKLNKICSDLTFDDSKARIAFGWNPKHVLEGVKSFLG
jgi:nucleoside-diphosphate-sugar epimerase